MYKSKFLQNVLGEHSSKGSKVGFEYFEDTMPKGFSEKEKTKLTHPDSKKFLHKLQKPESPPDVIKLQTYFGMSPYPRTCPTNRILLLLRVDFSERLMPLGGTHWVDSSKRLNSETAAGRQE